MAVPAINDISEDCASQDSGDPMLAFWREWCAALEQAEGAGEDRRWIERGMVERIGYPRVLVARGSGGRPNVYAVDERGMAEALAGAERTEDQAWRRVEALTGRVALVPARSVGGVVAKLAVAVMLRETYGAEATEFPWPILGAALDDLRALAGA